MNSLLPSRSDSAQSGSVSFDVMAPVGSSLHLAGSRCNTPHPSGDRASALLSTTESENPSPTSPDTALEYLPYEIFQPIDEKTRPKLYQLFSSGKPNLYIRPRSAKDWRLIQRSLNKKKTELAAHQPNTVIRLTAGLSLILGLVLLFGLLLWPAPVLKDLFYGLSMMSIFVGGILGIAGNSDPYGLENDPSESIGLDNKYEPAAKMDTDHLVRKAQGNAKKSDRLNDLNECVARSGVPILVGDLDVFDAMV